MKMLTGGGAAVFFLLVGLVFTGAGAAHGGQPPAKLGSYCNDVDSCKKFCTAHCKLDLKKWASSCSLPAGLGGSIPAGSSLLHKLPAMKNVKGEGSVRATDEVIRGLQRLDAEIAGSATWPKGHTVMVRNCHRPDTQDSTSECDYILKGWHIKEKWATRAPESKKDHAEKALGDRLINPPKNLGLMWPGATPHSAGLGCDLVVRDPKGQEVTTCKANAKDTKAQALSKALVDALTNPTVGALRLNYENWHFEWGGAITGCRCRGDDCNKNHYPILCDGPQHCAKPQ